MASIALATVKPARRVRGRLRPASDKSISHRYALLAALADGRSSIHRYSAGADCAATLDCLERLGVVVERRRHATRPTGELDVLVTGRGVRGLTAPAGALDAQNSGSTMRMLSGVLAAHPFTATIGGDASLTRRPMGRIIEPLERMGARLEANDGRPPLRVTGGDLRGIDFTPDIPSAQVKSAVLLAGLQAAGRTRVVEPAATRNHTELAFRIFGADVGTIGRTVTLEGGQRLQARELVVPGDLSSAAFWAVAAAGLPESDLEIEDVGLNPTRTALLDVLERAGARVERHVEDEAGGEPRGTVRIRHGGLKPRVIGPDEVPGLIDELPALAALATFGGDLRVTGAAELRVKESDRISAVVTGLRALGGDVDELPDGFHVHGTRRLRGGQAESLGDHRVAMALAIAALGAEGPTQIVGAEAVAVSYPEFFERLQALCE
jgi:3-phosphoshikimate 1-carboxyvinyltransferase